jgi:murein DD-endopeptidase MepM/ murein hydrolase activator NlpD
VIDLVALAFAAAAEPAPRSAFTMPPVAVEPAGPIEAVVLHPLFREPFVCGEHVAGEESIAGDALGTDCQIIGETQGRPRGFGRLYRGDGTRNEDWYSWGAEVLAPADGEVVGLLPNPSVNEPGKRGKPPAGLLQIRRADGVVVMMAHLTDFAVALGDRVTAGQVIARVGNNGPSYAPHVHVGASRGATPLQIRWDQRAMGALAGDQGMIGASKAGSKVK